MEYSSSDFPQSFIEPFLITSPALSRYNCIAWAYGDSTKFYWPDKHMLGYWPPQIKREVTKEAFISLYGLIGYKICKDDSYEFGFEKIAIYLKDGLPTHAARQLDEKFWSSKLGQDVDVSHSLSAMENGLYGNAKIFMKRKKQ